MEYSLSFKTKLMKNFFLFKDYTTYIFFFVSFPTVSVFYKPHTVINMDLKFIFIVIKVIFVSISHF